MEWICYAPDIVCLCPSPSEALKSGVFDIVEVVKEGFASIDEVSEAALNYVGNNVNQLRNEMGDVIDDISELPGDLFDQYLQPIIDKLLDWMKFIFESILDGTNFILDKVTDVVYDTSVILFKGIFEVCLGVDDIQGLGREILNYLFELFGSDFDSIESYIKSTEPFKTIITLFTTLEDIIKKIESIVTYPQRLLEYLVDKYIRPFVVDYFRDLLPFEKIPIPDFEDLILNVAVDNVFNVGQLFGDPTAGISKSMGRIVEWLIKLVGNEAFQAENNPDSDVPDWRFDLLGYILTLEGIVVGFLTFHPAFAGEEGAGGKIGQVGTALTVVGIALGYLNIINAVANTATSGKFDDDLAENLNGVKAVKDLAVTNSTALILTVAGLVTQLIGGATPYEYIPTALSFLVCIGGFACAIGNNSISSEPILVALEELYDDLGYKEEEHPNIVEGAKNNDILIDDPKVNELYADYKNPEPIIVDPVVRVDVPWYGPDIIKYCFVDPDHGREVASDFIDEDDNIKGMWISVRVRNESVSQTRIFTKFYYSIDNGPLQLICDATNNKENGDLIRPHEFKDVWYQNWDIPNNLINQILEGKCRLITKIDVAGDYNVNKSQLENSIEVKIPPYLKISPIVLTSSGSIGTKTFNETQIPQVKEGDILTFSTKIRNTGGAFVHYKNLPIRWYLDDQEGKSQLISKQYYNSASNSDIEYNEEISVEFTIDSTNLGLGSFGIEGWIRNVKIAILEEDFDKFMGENIPIFTREQEEIKSITFDYWPPILSMSELSLDNLSPTEGETVHIKLNLKNQGEGPLNLRKGNIIFETLDNSKSSLAKDELNINLMETTFRKTPFDNGNSTLATDCKIVSFQFIPTSDMWIDSIQMKSESNSSQKVRCEEISILYLGYKIAEFSEYNNQEELHYLQNPILLKEGETYYFEFKNISGQVLIEDGRYFVGGKDVILNSIITLESGDVLFSHPKFKLHCSKSIPPHSKAYIEHIIDTTNKEDVGILRIIFESEQLNIHEQIEKNINIYKKDIKAFKLECEKNTIQIPITRKRELPIILTKEDDVDTIEIEFIPEITSLKRNNYIIYLKDSENHLAEPIQGKRIQLFDDTPKQFLIGIAASKKVMRNESLTFSLKGEANVDGDKIIKTLNFVATITEDFSNIFHLICEEPRRELKRNYSTKYDIKVINNSNTKIALDIISRGESESESRMWDYFFTTNNAKNLNLEFEGRREDILFQVRANQEIHSMEVLNRITASYNWNPLDNLNEDFILKKNLELVTSFQEKDHPLGVTFRSSPNAGDPGVTIKLITQLNIFPAAKNQLYNVFIKFEGNLEMKSRPPSTFKLENGKSRKLIWEARIPEDSEIGSKIPLKLITGVAEDPRNITKIINLDVTNNRMLYEFVLKRDWRILSVIKGKGSTLKISVENIGRKTDIIDISLQASLPNGWRVSPKRKRLSLSPDMKQSFNVNVYSPNNARVGEGGVITIRGVSKGNRSFIQTKRVTVKSAPPGSNWSLLLKTNRKRRKISSKGTSSFNLTLINNGNRPLGEVNLSIQHKYNPIQFKTELVPNKLNLRSTGATRNAKAIIEPRLTGPGKYKFDIIARWEERILYAQDSQRVEVEYGKESFFKSKFGLITIGLVAVFAVAAIAIIYFLS